MKKEKTKKENKVEKVNDDNIDLIIAKTEDDIKSRAKRVNNLFLKYKKWFSQTYETVDFKEPVMQLIRNSGGVEFYENVTAGMFEYVHSDGEKRFILLNPSKQLKFGFANKMFKGYICHENLPLPLPQDPYLTSEQMNITIEKSLHDTKVWKAKELKAKSEMWWKIALGIIGIILAVALYKMLVPNAPEPNVQIIKDTVVRYVENATTTIL